MIKHHEFFGKNYNLNDRVLVKLPMKEGHYEVFGTIGGIAWQHLTTGYIVVLDNPLDMKESECYGWLAICVTPDLLELI